MNIPSDSNRPASSAVNLRPIRPAEWEELRKSFHQSMLAETPLLTLSQNVDGAAWPDSHATDTPLDFIDLTHTEALALLNERGLSSAHLDVLADILRGTLAFDRSFGAMVEVAGKAEAAADPVRKNLEKLGIPADFPIDLCNLSFPTLALCQAEKIYTLSELLDFARGASRRVFVGGEFQSLLNGVYQKDEALLARHLPYRPRHSGLHLIEGLAHLVRELPIERRVEIARLPATCPIDLQTRAQRLASYFQTQLEELSARRSAGMSIDRYLVTLDDLSLESAVAGLLNLLLPSTPPQSPVEPNTNPKEPAPAPQKRARFWKFWRLGSAI